MDNGQNGMERKKLNIAIVCDPIGSNKAGGIVSAVRFGRLLQERGHRVIFIGAKLKEHRTHNEHEGMRVYRFRSIPLPKSGGWYTAFPTIKEIKKVLQDEKIDVVHIQLPMSAALVAVKAAKSLGIKIVAGSHSQPENLFMDMPKFLRPVLDRSWNAYLAWLYSKAESIIYPSRMALELLDHLTAEGKPSAVVSNGVNIDRYRPVDVGDFHIRFNIPADAVKLFYIGRLFPEKSLDTLVNAVPAIVRAHPQTHVMIAGRGHVLPQLERLTDALGMRKHISFLDLNDEDKILAYNASDIFVSPSFAELEGMTVLEAMACGKPIIVPDGVMNAARHFVSDNGLLFKTADSADLAVQVIKLIGDAELRKAMGDASLKKSRMYDIQRSVEKQERVYYDALKMNS